MSCWRCEQVALMLCFRHTYHTTNDRLFSGTEPHLPFLEWFSKRRQLLLPFWAMRRGNRTEYGRITGFWFQWNPDGKLHLQSFANQKGKAVTRERERRAIIWLLSFQREESVRIGSRASDAKLLFAYLTLWTFSWDSLPTLVIAHLRNDQMD